ncbi:MAG: polyprenyl synthetase family protein [Alphaproteobacteria bacterium]|nr:polyprenyl synthetase family protein [Alphaproteobacteria bacterium]
MSSFAQKLKWFSDEFNGKLGALFPLPEGNEKRVVEAMYYSVANGGKRLRPYLVIKTAGLFGVSAEQAFITAAALECLHTYSLIHDDLPAMDNDDLRRGKPTCHKQFDEATAILAGDGLLTYAFELISKRDNNFSDEVKCQLIQLLAQGAGAFGGMVAGQMLDLDSEKSENIISPEKTIKHIEEMKTGRLLRFACEAGAVMGNASQDKYNSLVTYAKKIGIAFQIADDVLDVEGKEEEMGKTLGKDSEQNKLTFVRLYGLDRAKQMARDYIYEAKHALAVFGSEADDLRELADFIIERKN